jgi:hypothetical protein
MAAVGRAHRSRFGLALEVFTGFLDAVAEPSRVEEAH